MKQFILTGTPGQGPTGGHERLLITALRERGIPFIRVHPNEVIAFRYSRGGRAKSDPIDARLIHTFATQELSRRGGRCSLLGDERLRALAARRRQLIAVLQAERCRLALAAVAAVRDSLELVIAAFEDSLAALEAELAAAVADNRPLTRSDRRATPMPAYELDLVHGKWPGQARPRRVGRCARTAAYNRFLFSGR
jgi:transposase